MGVKNLKFELTGCPTWQGWAILEGPPVIQHWELGIENGVTCLWGETNPNMKDGHKIFRILILRTNEEAPDPVIGLKYLGRSPVMGKTRGPVPAKKWEAAGEKCTFYLALDNKLEAVTAVDELIRQADEENVWRWVKVEG